MITLSNKESNPIIYDYNYAAGLTKILHNLYIYQINFVKIFINLNCYIY